MDRWIDFSSFQFRIFMIAKALSHSSGAFFLEGKWFSMSRRTLSTLSQDMLRSLGMVARPELCSWINSIGELLCHELALKTWRATGRVIARLSLYIIWNSDDCQMIFKIFPSPIYAATFLIANDIPSMIYRKHRFSGSKFE